MIPVAYIETVLNAACANLGYPVANAYFYRDIVPPEITDEMLMAECERLLAQGQTSDALQLAEMHVARYFSTARLLQMKVWYDTFPHEDCPKLDAVYTWANAVTIQAAQGNTNFQDSPHTFSELVAEAMSILGAGQ